MSSSPFLTNTAFRIIFNALPFSHDFLGTRDIFQAALIHGEVIAIHAIDGVDAAAQIHRDAGHVVQCFAKTLDVMSR